MKEFLRDEKTQINADSKEREGCMNDTYLMKAKRKNWEMMPLKEQWVVGFYFNMRHNDNRSHLHHFIIPLDTDLEKGRKIEEIQVEVDPSTRCRSTGLCDKRMKLIWENDIVNGAEKRGSAFFRSTVQWNERMARFDLIAVGGNFQLALEEYADGIAVDGCDYEVVGNKFDGLTEEVVLSFLRSAQGQNIMRTHHYFSRNQKSDSLRNSVKE